MDARQPVEGNGQEAEFPLGGGVEAALRAPEEGRVQLGAARQALDQEEEC
jgi:hypothetical protein